MTGCKHLEIVSTKCRLNNEYCQFRLAKETEYYMDTIWGKQKLLNDFVNCEKADLFDFGILQE